MKLERKSYRINIKESIYLNPEYSSCYVGILELERIIGELKEAGATELCISVDIGSSWGEPCLDGVSLFGCSMYIESDEEYNDRVKEAEYLEQRSREIREERERQQYEKLKAKFEIK